MDEKSLIILLLPLVALFMILAWCVMLTRNGRPLSLRLKGFGISIQLDSKENDEKHQNG